ncbi:tetratricopeptide repeat protein [Polyangium spumosum]|uniref:Tetratricopeptide repeat protein n=1 Tax=Polyangium spumosum TaxID=889282 RepID=A0A6N7PN52_9BACT|nr:tetratricopeptide repeat protein [Polyangium spumosum]MRG93339.1 tetratricopeptide repeat protein [Polyangium spumosum]
MSKDVEWVMIGLDPKMSRRQGMPPQLPIPKSEFEGLADKGLSIDNARKWIKSFLNDSPAGKDGNWRKKNSQLVSALEVFLDKAPLLDRAQNGFAENDFEKALSALKRIASMDPDDHAARLNLAAAQTALRDYPAALKTYQSIRKTFEGDADYHVGLGQVHATMGNKDAAIDEFVLALEAQPDCQPALDALAKLGVLVPVYENPRDATSLTYVRSDKVDEYLTSVWDAEARDAAYYLEQLAYHERESRPLVVLAIADRIVKLGDAASVERGELARIAALRDLGRRDEALAAAKAYVEKAPKSAGAHVELGRCLAALGNVDEARAALDKALEADPGDLLALQYRFWPADAATNIQGVSNAIPALTAFAEAHPNAVGAWRSLARAKIATGAKDEGIDLLKKAVALRADDDDLRAELWTQLGNEKRYQEIVDDAGKLENLAKRDWKLRWNEAEAYLGLEKKIEARGAFSAINFDDSLHVDIRKRAKRAVKSIDEGLTLGGVMSNPETPPAAT